MSSAGQQPDVSAGVVDLPAQHAGPELGQPAAGRSRRSTARPGHTSSVNPLPLPRAATHARCPDGVAPPPFATHPPGAGSSHGCRPRATACRRGGGAGRALGRCGRSRGGAGRASEPRAGPGAGPRRSHSAARGHRLARAPAERRGHHRRAGRCRRRRRRTIRGRAPETPLHWAASSDDVEAVAALLDAGADIDAPGAVIGGGTPLNDATAFGQWDAARVLVERGAVVSAWDAAALGMTDRVAELLHNGAVDSLDAFALGRVPRWPARHGSPCWSTPAQTSTGGAGTP